MTNEKIFASEMIDMDQLDNISGGTVAEFNDIYNAFEKKVGTVGEVSNGIRTIVDAIPVAGKVSTAAWHNIAAPLVEKGLKDVYGIDANISIGWLGSGFRESGNIYSKNGKGLSHQEVLNIINAA